MCKQFAHNVLINTPIFVSVSKLKYGSHLKEVRKMLENEKCKKAILQKENRQAEEAFKKHGKQLEEANKNFQKAIDSMPSGWDIIGMNFVEGFTNSINSLIGGATNATIAADSSDTHTKYDTSGSPKDMFASNNIVSKSSILLAIAQSLVGLIQKDQIEWSKFLDEKTGQLIPDWLKTQIEDVLSNIKDVDQCPAKPQAEKICEQGITICSDLSALAPEGKHDDDAKNKELIQRIRKLMTSAQQFDSSGKKDTKTSAFFVNPPGMSKARSASSGSASQTATENARFRIEQMKTQLANAREMYEKSLEKMEEKNRVLVETLNKMRNLHVEGIDFDTTIKMLAEGLSAMGELQEKWHKMVQFFQMVSNIIDTCLNTSLQDLVKTARKPDMKYDSNMFLKDMIYQQAFQASNIANLVNMISGTYTEVSSKYLMDRVGSLGRLMALDPKDPRFKGERIILADSCDDAGKDIKALVLKNKELYKARTKARLEKIENELNAVLPPPSEKETNKLREIVASGFQNNPEDIDQFE
uniref:Zgc:162509 n=2 Tax=Salmo trutta TaxID=8032 RepID=A0A674BQD6_SALTR